MYKRIGKYLIFVSPLLLKYIFILVFAGYNLLSTEDTVEDLFFCLIIGIILYVDILEKKLFNNLLLVIYVIYFILEGTSYLSVNSNFTSSFMYVLLEASNTELVEFVDSYKSMSTILFLVLSILSLIFLKKLNLKKQIKNKYIIGFLSLVILVSGLKISGFIESNAYHNIVRGIYGYVEMQNNFSLDTNTLKEDISLKSNNEVMVIVLGESTNRSHMQLYNYNKPTTPYLSKLKDSLFVYDDVISTDVQTFKSIPKMLTSLSTFSNGQGVTNIVEVFNKAGFSTYWLSNQRPISFHDNAISKIASNSSYFKFYNHKIDKHTDTYDEIIIPKYRSILKEKGKKLIVLRLIGTHFDYEKRYPETFAKFFPTKKSKKETVINHYDNAILYNDFILKSIIELLNETNNKSALIYLSDHGENVYDEGDFFGRTEANLTKGMLDIPFIVWTSKNFALPKDFEYKPNRKFMTDNLYESIGHLFGVKHIGMDFSKSLFSNTFEERKRVVVTGIDYDEYFEVKYE
ncbi:MAG: sulfatase-like hydrolase/transferase [Bacteroidia bacterium]|nr:sulfatase-like hydrolase/transferase [Bacteroidia bacterium]